MRFLVVVPLLLTACGEGPKRGYLGDSEGTVLVDGKERKFDGGALELRNPDGLRMVIVTTNGWHFTCDWAEGQFSLDGGPAVDRQGKIWDLVWDETRPDEAYVQSMSTGLFGGGEGGSAGAFEATASIDEDGIGEIDTARGNVAVRTHLCPTEIEWW